MSSAPEIVDWFGTVPEVWSASPDRDASVALWRLESPAANGFRAEPIADAHMICVHLNGRMDWSAALNDRRYHRACETNTFCMARAGESADVEYANANITFAHLFLPVRWFESDSLGLASSSPGGGIELIDPMNARSFDITALARRTVRAMAAGRPAARLEIDANLLGLAAKLVQSHSSATPRSMARGGLASAIYRRVVEYLQEHVSEEVALADLAELSGLSVPHFCRAFRESSGLPPHRYQIALRIERATHLLLHSKLAIADVGIAVGYNDPAYFSRIFSHEAGLSPSAWRKTSTQ